MTAEHAKPAEDADQTAKRLRAALLGASVRGDSAALDAAVRESATLCGITKQHTLAAWVRVLRARARDDGVEEGRGGAVAVIQRFGGALNLNVHVHALVLDGVFARHRAGALSFHPIRRLTTLDVAEVLATVEPLIMRRLERRGFGPGDGEADAPDAWRTRRRSLPDSPPRPCRGPSHWDRAGVPAFVVSRRRGRAGRDARSRALSRPGERV